MSDDFINQMTADDAKKMQALRVLAYIDKMVVKLETDFPGFWEGADKQTRRNWVNQAIDKADQLGAESMGEGETAIYMFAYLGLEFEKIKEFEPFVKFINEYEMTLSGKMTEIISYIEWEVFGEDLNFNGDRISMWALRDILNYLPEPKRKLPEL